MKRPHILSTPKSKQLPKYVIFYDTETKEITESKTRKRLVLEFGLAIFTYRDRHGVLTPTDEILFTTSDEFNNWLISKIKPNDNIIVTAHNIAFDLRITDTLKFLSTHGFTRTLFIEESLNFIAKYRCGTRGITFTNNQQLFSMPLKALGESIGLSKLDMPDVSASREEWLAYNRRDVEVMIAAWNHWFAFIRDNDLGNFQLTAASQAMSAYRHRFMPEPIYIHNSAPAINLERQAYHGGRVECFFIGEKRDETIYNLDVNSMYPFVMTDTPVPTKLLHFYRKIRPELFDKLHKEYGYIIEATVTIKEPKLPSVQNDFLHFPIGTFRGVFCKPEFEELITLGEVSDLGQCTMYEEKIIFKEYIDFFYKSRLKWKAEGNNAFSFLGKLMMNGLYGKFGQKQRVYKQIGTTNEIPDGIYLTQGAAGEESFYLRVLDGIVEKSVGYEEGYNAFPAVAATITSAARAYLLRLLRVAGWENVLYCDTDSLFVNGLGYERLGAYLDPQTLGKLKLELSSDYINIRAPKWYEFAGKTVLKGIRKGALRVGDDTYEQDKFLSYRGALRSHNLKGVIVDRVRKTLRPKYKKGIITSSGRVTPLVSSLHS